MHTDGQTDTAKLIVAFLQIFVENGAQIARKQLINIRR
jgi:hypothetical protein